MRAHTHTHTHTHREREREREREANMYGDGWTVLTVAAIKFG